MAELRFLCDGPSSGAENMERDRAMWRHFETDPSPGIRLRVYGWRPAALSLGFHQSQAEVDPTALERRGFDLVRRPTGGAAVLHVDEITYAVAAPLGLPGLGRGVLEIHGAIARALASTLRALGIAVDLGGGGVPQEFACFAAAGGHEITVGGRKLVGSALRRGRRAFLQHGSMLAGPAHLDLVHCIAGLDAEGRARERERLAAATCTLADVVQGVVDPGRFASGLAAHLARACSMTVVESATWTDLLRP